FAYLGWRCSEIERAIAELDARAAELAAKKRLPLLAKLRVATPCSADWDQMPGDENVRYCGSCKKNVYNLSALTSREAEALLREKEGDLCATYFERADGTILTSDCPTAVRAKWAKRAGAAAVLVGGAVAGVMTVIRTAEAQSRAVAITDDVTGYPPPPTEAEKASEPPRTGILNPQTFADVPRPPPPPGETTACQLPRPGIRRALGGMKMLRGQND
ncbi:MAG TPA: hypothetical protein VF407_14795, partial [Polyangiaceae bacterium]